MKPVDMIVAWLTLLTIGGFWAALFVKAALDVAAHGLSP